MIKTAVVKLLTVKAVTVAALVVGTGGVALAASTGALPNPLNSHPTPAASAGQSHTGDAPAASPHPGGSADPSPSLVGLCKAYTAGAATAQGKALDNPAFHALLAAAGGKDNVDSYCTNLLATTAATPAVRRVTTPAAGPVPTPAAGRAPTPPVTRAATPPVTRAATRPGTPARSQPTRTCIAPGGCARPGRCATGRDLTAAESTTACRSIAIEQ